MQRRRRDSTSWQLCMCGKALSPNEEKRGKWQWCGGKGGRKRHAVASEMKKEKSRQGMWPES